MSENCDKDPEKLGPESWLNKWEDQCVQNWEDESNMDDLCQHESQKYAQIMWHSFQNSATAISHLYKERSMNGASLWVPFQNSASCVTLLYKDSLNAVTRNLELGAQCGQQRRTKELIAWAKKRKRNIRREELIAFLCGRNPPPRHRASPSVTRSSSRVTVERASPRLANAESGETTDETDLQPFRDALALQGLSGAMSNISVGYGGSSGEGVEGRPHPGLDDFHYYILDEMSRRCDNGRKRTAGNDVLIDSPSRKRNRLL